MRVVVPQRLGLVLAAHVPHSEADVLVLHGLHMKLIVGMVVTISPSFSVYRMVVFPAASRPPHENARCFFAKKAFEEVCKDIPHAADRWEQHWPEKPSEAAAQMLLGGRPWFRSHLHVQF